MPFHRFYLASLFVSPAYAVKLAARKGLQGPQIVRLIQRAERKRQRA